jgi:hypothetical protein
LSDTGGWLVAVGATLVLVVSVALALTVLFRDVGLNPLNLFTIVLGSGAAALAFLRPDSVPMLMVANILLIVALLPTLIGGAWILYLPSLLLFIAATIWRLEHPSPR